MSRIQSPRKHRVAALVAVVFFCSFPDFLTAHPGHGAESAGIGVLHYLTAPMHAGPLLLLAVAGFAGLRWAIRLLRSENDQ